MDNKNMILDQKKLSDYIYNSLTKINNLNENKLNTSAIYESILSYINSLKSQKNVQNINNNSSLDKLKKEIVSHLDNAGKELENLEDIMTKAAILANLIQNLIFSKNIFNELEKFHKNSKNAFEFLEDYYKNNKVPTEELKNYVACELLIYKFLDGIRKFTISRQKPMDTNIKVKIFSFSNKVSIQDVEKIKNKFGDFWLFDTMTNLIKKQKFDIIFKCFKLGTNPNQDYSFNDEITVRLFNIKKDYTVGDKVKLQFSLNNILKIASLDAIQGYTKAYPIWPLILRYFFESEIKFDVNKFMSKSQMCTNLKNIIALRILGGNKIINYKEFNIIIERNEERYINFKNNYEIQDKLNKLKRIFDDAKTKKGIVIYSDKLSFIKKVHLLVNVNNYSFSYINPEKNDNAQTTYISNSKETKYQFISMTPNL